MQYLSFGGIEFSRIFCGTNAFYGRSHFSDARDREYRDRFTDDRVIATIEACRRWGINTVETSANERITAILGSLNAKPGIGLHCVGSTRIDHTSTMKSHHQKLDYLIRNRTAICVIHSQYIDNVFEDGRIQGLDAMLGKIHEAGLIAGVSTHSVKTVELCERLGYPVDTYLFPLNATGFVYPGYPGKESPAERIALVRGVAKPFILMKVFGAGRIPPEEGLPFVFENAKPNDFISLGFGSEEEAEETMKIATGCEKKYMQ